MQVDLNPHDIQVILKWWEASSEGIFGSLGGITTLRSTTLADRLADLLAGSRSAGRAEAEDSPASAVRRAEEVAGRILRDVTASVSPELERRGYQLVYAGIVHALPRDDPRYWSVADLQVEPVGVERPTYEFLVDDIPVWRDGQPCLGDGGAELRRRLVAAIDGWLARMP